ncbi:hypothetical protein GCM10011326_27840 [Salipiger profundus]|nr:hypothetical protein GCM10011326_27840 [Salipiger profundus]
MHKPILPDDAALFTIWAQDQWGRRSLAAGTFVAINATWNALQEEEPAATLRIQQGACHADQGTASLHRSC